MVGAVVVVVGVLAVVAVVLVVEVVVIVVVDGVAVAVVAEGVLVVTVGFVLDVLETVVVVVVEAAVLVVNDVVVVCMLEVVEAKQVGNVSFHTPVSLHCSREVPYNSSSKWHVNATVSPGTYCRRSGSNVPFMKCVGCSLTTVQFVSVPFHVRNGVQDRTMGSFGTRPSLQLCVACVPTSKFRSSRRKMR